MQLKDGFELQNGKYRIIRVLGQGGFGITYLAQHTTLDKLVAIKEFFPKNFCVRNVSSNEVIVNTNNIELVGKLKKRFLKEAKNIAKLDHPGIVKIHDIFEENSTAYYVMDYINGENLSQIVKQNGPLPEEKAIEYICKVGEALEYMHSKRMTHFDVKPANVILREDTETPVLIDFGLSKQYNIEGEETSTLLQAVSNGFSPIELYNVETLSEFSPQTDVYSLGATLYYILTGLIPPAASDLISNELTIPSKFTKETKETIHRALESNKAQRTLSIKQFCANLPTKENKLEKLLTEKTKEEQRIEILSNLYHNLQESMKGPFILVSFILVGFIGSHIDIVTDFLSEESIFDKNKRGAVEWYFFTFTQILLSLIPLINYLYIVWPDTFLSKRYNKFTKYVLFEYKIETFIWAIVTLCIFVFGSIEGIKNMVKDLENTSIIGKIILYSLWFFNLLLCIVWCSVSGIQSIKININHLLAKEWNKRKINIKSTLAYVIISGGLFLASLIYLVVYRFV